MPVRDRGGQKLAYVYFKDGLTVDRWGCMTTLKIDGLNRDVLKKRSIVMLKWEDDPEKRIGLVVPFDCPLDNLKAEAEKAVRALAKELETATIQGP